MLRNRGCMLEEMRIQRLQFVVCVHSDIYIYIYLYIYIPPCTYKELRLLESLVLCRPVDPDT